MQHLKHSELAQETVGSYSFFTAIIKLAASIRTPSLATIPHTAPIPATTSYSSNSFYEALQHLGQYIVPRRWKNSSDQKNAPNPHNFGAKILGDSTAL